MNRWQYRLVNIGLGRPDQAMGKALSLFGQRGWELVSVVDKQSGGLSAMTGINAEALFLLFKRPVPEGIEPDGPWAEVWSADQVQDAYAGVTG